MRLSHKLLLLGSSADRNRIAAQKRGEQGRGEAKIDARHLFADEVDIEGASAQAAVLLGNEQQLNAELVRVAHVVDDLFRALVALVEFDQYFVRQPLLAEVPQRLQTEL